MAQPNDNVNDPRRGGIVVGQPTTFLEMSGCVVPLDERAIRIVAEALRRAAGEVA